MFSKGFIRGLKEKKTSKSLYLFFEMVLDLDILLCFRPNEQDRLRLFDGSGCFFCCGDFEGFLFFIGDDLTILAKELRYSDALHCGKVGSLVCSVLVMLDWSSIDSKVPKSASLNHKKDHFNTIYIRF